MKKLLELYHADKIQFWYEVAITSSIFSMVFLITTIILLAGWAITH